MNFILQLNAFFEWLQANSLSPNAQLLYYTLLQINNKCGWISWFQRTNPSLCGIMGISENTLKAARNELKIKGLIDFKPGKKRNDPTKYNMIELYKQKRVSNFDTIIDTQDDTKLDTIPDTQTDDIYKLKDKLVVDVVDQAQEDCDPGLKEIVKVFSNNIHLITPFEYQKMQDWMHEMEASTIIFAIEESILQGSKSMAYIESILRSFKGTGVKTRAQAEDLKRQWQERKQAADKGKPAAGTAGKSGKGNPRGKDRLNAFHNFENRTYDNPVALEGQLIKASRSELSISDEDFAKFMEERKSRGETGEKHDERSF